MREFFYEFPYGIWIPGNDKKTIEKIKNYIQIVIEPNGYHILYFNGKRVRTPTDSGSHPCYNCGHCIDNGISACGNKICVRDRKNRKLCNNYSWRGRGKTWVHNIDRDVIFQKNKKGINYNWAICHSCNLTLEWLVDYPQEQHIKEFYKFNTPLTVDNSSFSKLSRIIQRGTSRGAIGELRHCVLQRDNYKCRDCGATKDEIRLEIDHIVPWIKGGKTILENLQTLCHKCNRSKHTRIWVGGQ